MLFNIAWRTVRRIPAVTECSTRALPVVDAYFAMAMFTTLLGMVPRQSPRERTFHPNTHICWTGIKAGAKAASRTESRTTHCLLSGALARNSGPMSTRTNTCAGFAKAGHEPNLLGHSPLYLSMGGLRDAVAGCSRASHEDASPGRSTSNLDFYAWRNFGQACVGGKYSALQKVRRCNIQCGPASSFRRQSG
jgi:hypothetical protein